MENQNLDDIIKEFVDSELNLIGYNDAPENSPDLQSNVGSKPTDYNVRLSQQDYSDADLARIGLFPHVYVHEEEGGQETEQDKLAKIIYEKVVAMLRKNNDISETEVKVQEDKLTDKKDNWIAARKDDELLSDKVRKINDLIADLVKSDKELVLKQVKK
jgi:hypothetical protein